MGIKRIQLGESRLAADNSERRLQIELHKIESTQYWTAYQIIHAVVGSHIWNIYSRDISSVANDNPVPIRFYPPSSDLGLLQSAD